MALLLAVKGDEERHLGIRKKGTITELAVVRGTDVLR